MAALANRQLGVVARWQLIELGIGKRTLERWLSVGRLHRIDHGGYAVGHANVGRRARSPLEERFLAFCRAHGIPGPATNVLVLGREVDCLWPAAKLVVELDSWEFHSHRSAFEGDRARDPKFLLAGYRTIRVTHRRLDREADVLTAEILGLLRLGAADRAER